MSNFTIRKTARTFTMMALMLISILFFFLFSLFHLLTQYGCTINSPTSIEPDKTHIAFGVTSSIIGLNRDSYRKYYSDSNLTCLVKKISLRKICKDQSKNRFWRKWITNRAWYVPGCWIAINAHIHKYNQFGWTTIEHVAHTHYNLKCI